MNLLQVPPELQEMIRLAVEIAVIFILTQLAKRGFDFSGFKAQITAAIVGAVIVFLNAALAKVPLEWEAIGGALLNLLVVVLGSFGLYQVYKQSKQALAARNL